MKMKKLIMIFAVVLSLVSFGSMTANAQTAKKGTDIFGYFDFSGKPPAGFKEISMIHLAGDYGAKEKPPTYGLIRVGTDKTLDYKLLKPTGKGKNISFTTRAVRGVSYKFDGAFTRLDVENIGIGEADSEKPVLKGKLIKLKDGKQTSEASVSFVYLPGT
jgi:hypothetical protein